VDQASSPYITPATLWLDYTSDGHVEQTAYRARRTDGGSLTYCVPISLTP